MKYILSQENCIPIILTLSVLVLITLPFAFCLYRGHMSRAVMIGKASFVVCMLALTSAVGFSKPYLNDAIDEALQKQETISTTKPMVNSTYHHTYYVDESSLNSEPISNKGICEEGVRR